MKVVIFVNDRKHLKASDRTALQFLEMSIPDSRFPMPYSIKK
ncbi:hypothetical protein [Moorena sp. SIO4A5]|nr:hypothetical protein [Moorena sp. SIO4A5]